jgi:UDP-GlcNAc:undecaprenyl-phosphate GlcNAc-1-phosphate transferase
MDHGALFYVQPFLLSMCISAFFCFVIIHVFRRIIVRDGQKYLHDKMVSRFGGGAIIFAFMITLFTNQYLVFDHLVWAMACGGMMIFFIGILDDLKSLSWKSQIFFQIALVLMIFIFGVRIFHITNPFGGIINLAHGDFFLFSLIFMLCWIVFVMNAVNWSDGIDGLSGGVSCIAALTLFIIALKPQVFQPPIAIIAIIFVGSVAGFLIFNFPQAKIFAGSSGSFFMGFILAILAIAAGAKIGTTLLVLSVPLMDALWVIGSRLYSGRSIFHRDHEHLHYRLLRRGWGVKKVLLLYYGITIFSAIVAIVTQSINKLMIFLIVCCIVIIFFVMISYETKKQTIA